MKKLYWILLSLTLLQTSYAAPPNSSRYYQDTAVSYNDDQTADAFGLVSTVSCMLNKIHPESNAGQPAYVAWVADNACDTNSSLSTSGSVPYDKATVLPTYNAATGILNVKMWLEGYNSDDSSGTTVYTPQYIWVNVDVNAGPKVAPPLGQWSLQYCLQASPAASSSASNDPSTCDQGYGYGSVTPTSITVFQKNFRNGVLNDERSGTATYSVVGGKVVSGSGQFHAIQRWDNTDATYSFAFSGDIYKLNSIETNTNSSASVCTSRNIDAVTPWYNNWNGWLYNSSSGDAFDLQGGFNIKLNAGTVTDWSKTGWVSYWGPWFPDKDSSGNVIPALVDGQTVYGNGRNSMDVAYTFKKALGSLQRQTIATKTLAEMDGVRFQAWLNANAGTVTGGSGNYLMYWNNGASRFESEGKYQSDGQGVVTGSGNSNVGHFSTSDLAGINQTDIWGGIPNSNTGIHFKVTTWNNTTHVNDAITPVPYQTSWDDIYPGISDAGLSDLADGTVLLCYGDQNNCPTAPSGTIQARVNYGHDGALSPVTYTWNGSTGNLMWSDGTTSYPIQSSTQRDIGPLFAQGTDLSSFACNQTSGATRGFWSPNNPNTGAGGWTFTAGGYCTGNAWSTVGTFYKWTTNTSSPNWPTRSFIVKQSTGKRPVFDKSVNVTYSSSAYASGATQYLTYNGGGQFWVPNTCYDKNSRNLTSCNGGGSNVFYRSNYDIPYTTAADGQVARLDNPSTKYLVRYLGRSFVYGLSSDTASCNALTPPNNLTLPTAFGWIDPHASGTSNSLGAWRHPTSSPLYVNGDTPQ